MGSQTSTSPTRRSSSRVWQLISDASSVQVPTGRVGFRKWAHSDRRRNSTIRGSLAWRLRMALMVQLGVRLGVASAKEGRWLNERHSPRGRSASCAGLLMAALLETPRATFVGSRPQLFVTEVLS
jgi:hypothetical protein